jgi:hypothetical protein
MFEVQDHNTYIHTHTHTHTHTHIYIYILTVSMNALEQIKQIYENHNTHHIENDQIRYLMYCH